MLVAGIGGTDYHIDTTWDDLTLRKAIKVAKLAKKMPEKLAEAYAKIVELATDPKQAADAVREIEKEITQQDRIKTLPKFYGEVLAICSDIPAKVVKTIPHKWRTGIYQTYYENLVFGCLHYPRDYEIKNIPHFFFDMGRKFDSDGKEIKKEYKRHIVKFYLPENSKGLQEDRPMGNEQAVVWTESADMEHFSKEMEAGNLTHAANICSIIARPKDKDGAIEEYDEKIALERARHFMDLPMSVVWEVFFCFIVRSIIYAKRDPIFFREVPQDRGALRQRVASIAMGGMGRLLRQLAQSTKSKKSSA